MDSPTLNTSTERCLQLAAWLYRLVEILEARQGATWRLLVETISGKTATIELDDCRLRLRATTKKPSKITIQPLKKRVDPNFRSGAETLRDVVTGRLTLDAALAAGLLYVRAETHDLLRVHQLVMNILADSAVEPALRRLWDEFDEAWPRPAAPPPCQALDRQRPGYGRLIERVPEDVLWIQV